MFLDVQAIQAEVLKFLPNVLIAIGILIAGHIAAKSSRRILKWIKKVFAEKTESDFDNMVLDALRKPTRYVIYSIAVILALEQVGINARNVVTAVLIISLVRPISELVQAVMQKIERDYVKQTKSMLDDTIFPLFNKTVLFSVYVLAIIIVLDQLGINVLTFIAGMGIAGLAIGLAAKDTLANIIAGIFIIIDRPFVVGDRIEAWSAPKQSSTWGDVMDIGLRSTKIRTTDNILLVIPNSEIARRDIINYTAISPDIRVRVPVGIAYSA
ncbi:mechanosensitive ion channel family protein, partial [archaeon]|nr:mechanosensitive ion channel family protein [archaeon]